MLIGLIREEKSPADNRVALTPDQCKWINSNMPDVKIIVESSASRCYSDDEYRRQGIEVTENVAAADILLGIKEVPYAKLIPNKTYLIFSHTIKAQEHNKKLLQTVLKNNITLIDYECLKYDDGQRILGFGFFAGIVGAHNGMMCFGNRTRHFNLPRVYHQKDFRSLIHSYFGLKLPNVKMKKIIYTVLIISSAILINGCSKSSSDINSVSAAANGGTGTGGSMARYTIVGNYLYTVDKQDLKVFDISTPSNTNLVNTVPVGFEIETIFPFKNRLFIGSTSVIHIFNIDNPSTPVKLSEAVAPNTMRRCDPVVAKDSVAYATLRTNGPCGGVQSTLVTYDIRNIATPIFKDQDFVSEPYGLGYADSTLYVCDRSGLGVYSITNPWNPSRTSTIDANTWYFDVIPFNNYLYAWINTGLAVYDITARRTPVLIKKVN